MQVGGAGGDSAARSIQAMNDILKMSVDATQDLSKKMVSLAAQQKLSSAPNSGIDLKA